MARCTQNLLLLALSLGFAFGVGEIVVRRFYPVDTGTSYEFRTPHPVFGWSLQPGASFSNRLPEQIVRVQYNSQGFHDIEHDQAKPAGRFRVVVLGDSFMEAYSVNFPDSFHARLAGEAREAGLDLEVVNLGVGGYGTLQQYLLFRDVGRLYEPDLVLLAFFPGNDVANNSIELERMRALSGIKVESRPFLERANDAQDWRITRVDFEGALRRYEQARQARSGWLRQNLRENSALLRLTWLRIKELRARFAGGDEEQKADPLRAELANLGVHRCNEPPEFTRAWELTRRSLVRLVGEVEDAGARLVVFNVPSAWETDPEAGADVQERSESGEELCFERSRAHGRLHEMLAELGIPMIDLLEPFRSALRDDGAVLFRKSDGHWDPSGHSVAARTVFAELERGNHLPPAQAAARDSEL